VVDPLSTSRPPTAMSAPPSAKPAAPADNSAGPVGTAQSVRLPSLARRAAAVVVGVLIMAVVASWVDFERAILVWLLFAIFLFLWPNWPPRTAGEQRAEAWPFLPGDR
jgi:hypothetical protein